MANYRYTAKTIEGKKRSGVLEAADETELYVKLREEGLYLLKSSTKTKKKAVRRIRSKALTEFSRELGTLLQSGVSLVRALHIISQEETIKPWQREIYLNILMLIRQGIPLSDAMEQQEGVFPELMIYMYRSAEMSGNIDQVALRMANHYDKEHRLNSKITSAMIYPAVILFFCTIAVIVLVTFVIPMFSSLFEMMDTLPLPTQIVLAISDAFQNYWYLILGGVVLLVVFFRWLFRIPAVRLWKDRLKVRVPYFGKLLSIIYTARFTRTLSSLYSSGLPIVSALQVGRKTVGNTYLESQFEGAISEVRGGGSLSTALGNIQGFSNRLPSTVMVGEETGRLDTMLNSVSDDLDYSAEVSINRLVALLEPALLLVMALIVGLILFSVLLPIINSYGAIENSAGMY